MSLKSEPIPEVPEQTRLVARAAFPKGTPYVLLRDELGTLFMDNDFLDLFPTHGRPAYSPWRLALVTILQFRENLSDRQAAEAVRSRIDWKYLLALELTDSGFDYSVLSEFRSRLLEGKKEALLLDKILDQLKALGLLKARGQQRSDSTHVLAAIRELNYLEHVCETMRAALNALAVTAPQWLRSITPPEWVARYGRRSEDYRLPQKGEARLAYIIQVGEDGFALLDSLESAPKEARELEKIAYLREVWALHYVRENAPKDSNKHGFIVRQTTFEEKPPVGERLESPYDPEVRYANKGKTQWYGYKVHLSESCDENLPHFLTHVLTTEAAFHDQHSASLIHEALSKKNLLPHRHLVDAGYMNIKTFVESLKQYGVKLIGPTMENTSWQKQHSEAFSSEDFILDWKAQKARCPTGKFSKSWGEFETEKMGKFVRIQFRVDDCQNCSVRAQCTTAKKHGRQLTLKRQEEYEALQEIRKEMAGENGQKNRDKRAGVEGAISQAVRGFGMRQTRYKSLAKTKLQHLATAAAINIDRFIAYKLGGPKAQTRTSHFALLMATI